jgi:regulator of protease activity HflC (stomatin/prohibitin superfamily)
MAGKRRPTSKDMSAWERAQVREAERQARTAKQGAAAQKREDGQRYARERRAAAEAESAALDDRVRVLNQILAGGLRRSPRIDLREFKRKLPPSRPSPVTT